MFVSMNSDISDYDHFYKGVNDTPYDDVVECISDMFIIDCEWGLI